VERINQHANQGPTVRTPEHYCPWPFSLNKRHSCHRICARCPLNKIIKKLILIFLSKNVSYIYYIYEKTESRRDTRKHSELIPDPNSHSCCPCPRRRYFKTVFETKLFIFKFEYLISNIIFVSKYLNCIFIILLFNHILSNRRVDIIRI
jgi:hypothetical protein